MSIRDGNRSRKIYSFYRTSPNVVEKGNTGPQGPQGPTGPQGPQGSGFSLYDNIVDQLDQCGNLASYGDLTIGSPIIGPSLTLTTGTSILLYVQAEVALASGTTGQSYLSVAVSGASSIAADDYRSATSYHNGTNQWRTIGGYVALTGLTAGSNTFTMKYKVSAGTTWSWRYRKLVAFMQT